MFKLLYSMLIMIAVACSMEPTQQKYSSDQADSSTKKSSDQKAKKKKVDSSSSDDDDIEGDEAEGSEHTHGDDGGIVVATTVPASSTTLAPTTSTTLVSTSSTTSTTKPASLGLKGVTLDAADPTRAIFRIPAGTAGNAWNNDTTTKVEINLTISGVKVLRIVNDDATAQTLHMDGGQVCGHQGTASATGGFYDCVIDATKLLPDGTGTKTYSHGKTGNPKFHLLMTK
jgi:hypothetical protein